MAQQLPYVGSKINLISHSEIRYEGTLAEIDRVKMTVSLINVRSFGTEGRRADLFIKPKPAPFAKIVFRGQDIKDLNVQQASAVEDPGAAFQDPAILAHEEVRPEPEAAPASPAAGAAGAKSLAEVKQAKGQAQRKKKEEQQQANAAAARAAAASAPNPPVQTADPNIVVKAPATAEEWNARTAGGRFHPARLNNRWKPDEKQQQQQQQLLQQQQQLRQRPSTGSYVRGRGPPVDPIDANIDIAATSAALEKEKPKLLEQTPAVADVTPAYNPSNNFFDNLGASSASRLASSTAAATTAVQPRRQNENALNRETFGTTEQQQPQVRQQMPQQARRYPQQPPVQQPYYNRVQPGSHGNRYGGHNRTGHHTYQRSQAPTGPRPGPRY